MNNGTVLWLIIFALSTLSFLVIALVVAVKGFADLRTLLQHSGQRNELQTEIQKAEEKAE